jgi:hypothetical protein
MNVQGYIFSCFIFSDENCLQAITQQREWVASRISHENTVNFKDVFQIRKFHDHFQRMLAHTTEEESWISDHKMAKQSKYWTRKQKQALVFEASDHSPAPSLA